MKTKAKKIVRKASPLTVITVSHPTLSKKALPVENPKDPVIAELIPRLIATMKVFGGVGIAAPQVNLLIRLIIVSSKPTLAYPKEQIIDPFAMINPVILEYSNRFEGGWEGCGSMLGKRGFVRRPAWVEVAYTDEDGASCTMRLKGLLSRVFQHEHDHLEGLMFNKRLDLSDELITEEEFQKRMKEKGKLPGDPRQGKRAS